MPHPAIFAAALAANTLGLFGLLLGTGALSPEDLTSADIVLQKLTAPRATGAPLGVYLMADLFICSSAVAWILLRRRRADGVNPVLTKE